MAIYTTTITGISMYCLQSSLRLIFIVIYPYIFFKSKTNCIIVQIFYSIYFISPRKHDAAWISLMLFCIKIFVDFTFH